MKTATALSLVCIATLFATARARADVPPPETEPCVGKAAGAECTYLGPGVCQEGTCSKLDYSKWDRDASSSPPMTTYPCLKCVTGTATNTATNTATTSSTATNTATTSPTNTQTNTATVDPTATDTNTATVGPTTTDTNTATTSPSANGTSSQTGTDTSSSSDSGWCSVGKGSAAGRWVPWLMAAAFSLLFLVGRRRR